MRKAFGIAAALAAAEKAGAARPCNDTEKMALKIGAVIVLNDWVVRSAALLDAEARQPYGAGLTTAGPYAPALRAGSQALQQKKDRAVAYKPVRDFQADRAVARVCAERGTVRWPSGARPCPDVPADDLKNLPASRFLVAGVESFAPLYADAAPAPATYAFKVEPKHPLASQNGQPLWQVYNDCSWAYSNAAQALLDADPDDEEYDTGHDWEAVMNAQTANMTGLANLGRAKDLSDQGQAFTERAIDAYAAQTGKPRPEAKAFVGAKDPVARLNHNQCGAIRPAR